MFGIQASVDSIKFECNFSGQVFKCVTNLQNYGKCLILVLALTTNVTNALHTLETPIREALLKPRNFNPHPYDQHFGHHHHQHHIHHDRSEQQAIDINAIDTVGEDYIDNSVYNILPTQEPSLPAFHPANHIYR